MNFYTLGSPGYIFYIYITNNLDALKDQSAKEYYKIIYIKSGTSHISINGNEYILTGAHVLHINEKDDLVFYEMTDCLVSIIFFKPSVINGKLKFENCNYPDSLSETELQDLFFLKNFKNDIKLSSKILPLNAFDSKILTQRLNLLNEKLTLQSISWPCHSRAHLLEILFSLIRPEENDETIHPANVLPGFSKLTIDVIYYLQSYYNQKITVEKLSQVFCTNRTTLLSDFKKNTGLSINQYIVELRMKIAATLLRDTELTINEICERTGFSDASYFSKSFKKELKYTPSEYRHINSSESYS